MSVRFKVSFAVRVRIRISGTFAFSALRLLVGRQE